MGSRYYKNDIVLHDGEFWTVRTVRNRKSDSPDYKLKRFRDRDSKEDYTETKASKMEKLKPKGGWKNARRYTRRQNLLASFLQDWGDGDFGKAYVVLTVSGMTGSIEVSYHQPSGKEGHKPSRLETGLTPKLALKYALKWMKANDSGHKNFFVEVENVQESSCNELVENTMEK